MFVEIYHCYSPIQIIAKILLVESERGREDGGVL